MTDERTIDDIKEDLKLAKAEMSPQEFVEEPVEEVVDEPSEEVEEVVEVEDSHGHITYEDWVSQGKDPDMWKGKKAFDAEYDRIQENKSLKSDVKDMKAAIDALTATFEDERERAVKEAYDKAEKDWQSKLIEATEVGDTEKVAELANNRPVQQNVQQSESPKRSEPEFIVGFRKENPVLDPNSPSYDAGFDSAVSAAVDAQFERMNRNVTPDLAKRILNAEFNNAKALYPELFESRKNTRKTTVSKPKAKTSKPSYDPSQKHTSANGRFAASNKTGEAAIRKAFKNNPKALERALENFRSNMSN